MEAQRSRSRWHCHPGIVTTCTEPCTDDILANQFGPVILRHAFPKAPSHAAKQTAAKIHELIKQATKPSSNRNALIQEINRLAASASAKQKGLCVDVLVKFKRLKDVWIDQVCTRAIKSSKLLQTAKVVLNAHTAERNAGAVDLDQYIVMYHSRDHSPSVRGVRGLVLTKLRTYQPLLDIAEAQWSNSVRDHTPNLS